MIKVLITFFQFKAMIRDTAIAARIKNVFGILSLIRE